MTTQICTFFLDDLYFGIDVQAVQEVTRTQIVTPVPLAPLDICGLMNLRGQIVTVIDLKQRLAMLPGERSPTQAAIGRLGYDLFLKRSNESVSLWVDEVGDVLELTDDQFEPPPATLKGKVRQVLQGAYKLEDKFLLVLDPDKVLANDL
jgi:purine-binding chemotaxis protein CheW